jgi:murein DD-endopeptidase MepM/ murein hydrolase activator NlpD
LVAGASGYVELARHNYFTLGHTVIIVHPDGMRTLYGHLSEIQVSEGQSIGQGDQIGTVGSTGRSTGPHLHFEVWEAGSNRRLNPQHYLPA